MHSCAFAGVALIRWRQYVQLQRKRRGKLARAIQVAELADQEQHTMLLFAFQAWQGALRHAHWAAAKAESIAVRIQLRCVLVGLGNIKC